MSLQLTAGRMAAFSDGVIAVIITVMVLDLKVPAHDLPDMEGLRKVLPMLMIYALSFVEVGIYWVNHHYMVDDVEQVSHSLLWANLGFLFSLSLDPIRNRMGRRTRPYSVRAVALSGLLCTPRCFLDCSFDRGSTPNQYASFRQSDKAGNFLGPLCRSHSGFVPLAHSRDGDACRCCGSMGCSTKTGFGNDAHQKHGSVKSASCDTSPFNCLSENSDCDFLEFAIVSRSPRLIARSN